MKLSYKAHTGHVQILGWQQRRQGAELLLTGPGFQAAGFSLGTYSPAHLRRALDALTNAPPRPRYEWARYPIIHRGVYTFTKPARFAACQGHDTRLAISTPDWEDHGDRWPGVSPFAPRTAALYMLGTPYDYRFLGRFRFEHAIDFIQEGIATGTPHRVQRRRTRGWQMPPLTVYVGRPTRWGSPCHADVLLSLANPGQDTIEIPSRSHAPLEQKDRP
jgi:hypothetical protein